MERSAPGHCLLFLLLDCSFSCFFVTSILLVLCPAAILLNYSIKLRECGSSLETRICPVWILLGRRRNNSMSQCKSELS